MHIYIYARAHPLLPRGMHIYIYNYICIANLVRVGALPVHPPVFSWLFSFSLALQGLSLSTLINSGANTRQRAPRRLIITDSWLPLLAATLLLYYELRVRTCSYLEPLPFDCKLNYWKKWQEEVHLHWMKS